MKAKARLHGKAKVNFGTHDFSRMCTDDTFFRAYQQHSNPSMDNWDMGQVTEVFEHENSVYVVVADRVDSLPGLPSEHSMEIRKDGTRAKGHVRPNGITLSYEFPKAEVRKHGLPSLAEVQEAFQQDGAQMLRQFYERQDYIEQPVREMSLSREGLPPHWHDALSKAFSPAKDAGNVAAEAVGSKKKRTRSGTKKLGRKGTSGRPDQPTHDPLDSSGSYSSYGCGISPDPREIERNTRTAISEVMRLSKKVSASLSFRPSRGKKGD